VDGFTSRLFGDVKIRIYPCFFTPKIGASTIFVGFGGHSVAGDERGVSEMITAA